MLLFKKEKEVVELIIKHLDMVEECLEGGIRQSNFIWKTTSARQKFGPAKLAVPNPRRISFDTESGISSIPELICRCFGKISIN